MTIVSSVAATALAKRLKNRRLPGVDRTEVAEPELQRSLDAIREHLHMYEGDASAPRERFITIQELEDTGLIRTQIKNKFAAITEVGGVAVTPPASAPTAGGGGSGGSGGPGGVDKLVDLLDTSTLSAVNGNFLTYSGGIWHNFDLYNSNAVITGRWTHNADLNMKAAINFIDSTSTELEMLVLNSAVPIVGDPIEAVYYHTLSAQETTSTSFVDTGNLDQSQTAFTHGDDILIVTHALQYNNNSPTTANGYQLIADGSVLIGSEQSAEIYSTLGPTGQGSPYGYVGWFTADTSGTNLISQHKKGVSGVDIFTTAESHIILNLTTSVPNHYKARSTTDEPITGPSWVQSDATVTVPAGDYLIFMCFNSTPGRTGTASCEGGFNDGSTDISVCGRTTQSTNTDIMVMAGAYLLEDYAGGTLTAIHRTTATNTSQCDYRSIVAIPLSDFNNWWGIQQDATEANLAAQSTPEVINTISIPTIPVTTNYVAIAWMPAEWAGTASNTSHEILENVNSGGDSVIGWARGRRERHTTSVVYEAATIASDARAYASGDQVDIKQNADNINAGYATQGHRNHGMILLESNGIITAGSNEFVVGDPGVITHIDGSHIEVPNNIGINWENLDGDPIELLVLNEAIGDPIETYVFQTFTNSTNNTTSYIDAPNGLDVPQSNFTEGDEIMIVSYALAYNNLSSAARENGIRLVVDDVELAGSQQLMEGFASASTSRGDLYQYVGWFTAGTTGNVNIQLKLGDGGTTYEITGENHFLLNLTQLPNHAKNQNTTPLAITGTGWTDLVNSVSLDTVDDWLIFCGAKTDIPVGTSDVTIGVYDGSTTHFISERVIQDGTDEMTYGGAVLLESFSGTVSCRGRTAGNGSTVEYVSIIAIPLSDFANSWSTQGTTTDVYVSAQATPEVMNTISIGSIPETGSFLAVTWGALTSDNGYAIEMHEDVNSAGDANIAWSEFSYNASVGPALLDYRGQTVAGKELRAYSAGDAVELTQLVTNHDASYATDGFHSHGMVLLQLSTTPLVGSEGFVVGDPAYPTYIDGLTTQFNSSVVHFTGDITTDGLIDGVDVAAHAADTDIHWSDAPNDGNNYVRNSLAWTELPPAITGLGIWRYRTETTAPPSSGQIRFDDADIGAATEFYLHETNDNGSDVSAFLDLLMTEASVLYIQDRSDATKYVLIELGTSSDDGTYRTYQIADILEGSGGEPSQNAAVTLITSSGSGGGSQTPWIANIDAAGFTLTDVGTIEVSEGPVDIIGSTEAASVVTVTNTNTYSGAGGGAGFRLRANDGSAINTDDRMGFLIFAAAEDASDTFNYSSLIEAYALEDWDASNNGSDLRFTVTPIGSSTRAAALTVASAQITNHAAKFEMAPSGPTWEVGTGTPEGAVTAPIGSLFTRSDGGASTTLYVKETGVGNTGWVANEVGGAGDVLVSGTPVNNQLAIWTDANTIEGSGVNLTWNGILNVGGSVGVIIASSGKLSMSSTTGDRIDVYGSSSTGYGFGIEASCLYYKSNGVHRWYSGQNADSGAGDVMELSAAGALTLGGGITSAGNITNKAVNGNVATKYVTCGANNGDGVYFENASPIDGDEYGIWTSLQSDSNFGGRIDTTSDFNMYFGMRAGTNRGYQFHADEAAFGGIIFAINPDAVRTRQPILFEEVSSDITSDAATWGQLWCKDDAPNTLYFTNDIGERFLIGGRNTAVGLTADVSSVQGGGVITASKNVYSTVANVGDAATLPATSVLGDEIYIKNDGANSMDVFPASGDDAGAGTDTAVAVAAGVGAMFIATVADATWTQMY